MKVKDLINLLSGLPPEMYVVYSTEDQYGLVDHVVGYEIVHIARSPDHDCDQLVNDDFGKPLPGDATKAIWLA